jgi:hypothetical protein
MSEKKSLMSDKTFNLFITSACVALAVLTLFLAWQNRNLKDDLAELRAPQIPPEALKAGDTMAPLTIMDEGGSEVTIEFGAEARKTLLLIFSPECPACAMTLPIWSDLFKEPPAAARVAGLRMGAEPEGGSALPFPVYTPDESGSGLVGKIPYVPTTLLVDEGGLVERIWFGVLEEEAQEELLDLLAGS